MSIKLVPFLFSFLSFLSSFLRPSFHLICLQNNSASSSTVTWTVRCTLIAFSLWKPRPVLLPRGDIATRMWYGPQKMADCGVSLQVDLILADPASKHALRTALGEASVMATKLSPQDPGQFDVENEVLSHLHFYKHVRKMPDKHKGTECLYLVQIQSWLFSWV